jgi:para-nitrobenzyl esterase
MEEARALSAEEILAASNELDMSYDFAIDDSYLTMAPLDAYAAGEYQHVPLIVGVNEGELTNMSEIYLFHSASVGQIQAMTANGDTVYTYLFDQTPANWSELGGRAVHSIDLAYVFGDYENTAGTFSGGPWAMNCLYWMTDCDMTEFIEPELTDVDKELSEEVMQMWVSFATDGDPSIDGVEWDPWTAETDNYLYITHMNGAECSMETGYTTLD